MKNIFVAPEMAAAEERWENVVDRAEILNGKQTEAELDEAESDEGFQEIRKRPHCKLHRLATADGRYGTKYKLFYANDDVIVHLTLSQYESGDVDIMLHFHVKSGEVSGPCVLDAIRDPMLKSGPVYGVYDYSQTPIPFLVASTPASLTFEGASLRLYFASSWSGDFGARLRAHFPPGTFEVKKVEAEPQ